MPKIDFYVIASTSEKERFLLACRLIEKAYQQQHRIYIHSENPAAAQQMDQLLWTYREDSFLPHNLYNERAEPVPPIQIGCDATPEKQGDILINLSSTIPVFYMQFQRILELISHDTTVQTAGRERYKSYRAQGHTITTHKFGPVDNSTRLGVIC